MTTNLDHLERLRAEATEGEWRKSYDGDFFSTHDDGTWVGSTEFESDAAWIVEITNAAPELLAEVRELRRLVAMCDVHIRQEEKNVEAKVRELRAKVQRVEALRDECTVWLGDTEVVEVERSRFDAALAGDSGTP